MKTMHVRVVFLIFSIMGFSALLPVDSDAGRIKNTLVIATDATMPPMEMLDSKGAFAGFDIEFINAVAREAGFIVEIRNHAWATLLSGLEAGEFDAVISTVTITKKRMERFDFSLPYVNIGQVLVVPIEMEAAAGLADMEGMKVGAAEGSLGAYEVKRSAGVQLKDYEDICHAFEDMSAGRIQGVVCDYITAADFVSSNSNYINRFRLAGPPFTRQECGIVVRKGNSGILGMINKGILAVESKGITDQLERRWLRNQHP